VNSGGVGAASRPERKRRLRRLLGFLFSA
jgi:hypothetical protein